MQVACLHAHEIIYLASLNESLLDKRYITHTRASLMFTMTKKEKSRADEREQGDYGEA